MKDSRILTALIIVVALLGALLGGFGVYKLKKCPQIRVGKETLLVTITVHDTVKVSKTVKDFVVRKDTVYIPDTMGKDTVTAISNCYSFDQNEFDGAYIKAEMCSKELPAEKPADLKGNITYKAAPDTTRTIARVDTVMRSNDPPIYKDWRYYTIALLAIVSGVLIFGHR